MKWLPSSSAVSPDPTSSLAAPALGVMFSVAVALWGSTVLVTTGFDGSGRASVLTDVAVEVVVVAVISVVVGAAIGDAVVCVLFVVGVVVVGDDVCVVGDDVCVLVVGVVVVGDDVRVVGGDVVVAGWFVVVVAGVVVGVVVGVMCDDVVGDRVVMDEVDVVEFGN